MTVEDRIRTFCKYKKLSIRQFEIQCNLSNGYVSSMRKGLGTGKLENVLNVFPELNREWLLYGEGKMLNGEVKSLERKTADKLSVRQIPLYDIAATAGFFALYRDLSSAVEDYITIPNLPPVDGAIYARGDSMSPLIASGDIVIFKKVELHPDNIIWGSIYIISYTLDGDDFTVLKYIRHSSKTGYVRLESYNPRFDPQDIPSSSITALALVKASITFHTIG